MMLSTCKSIGNAWWQKGKGCAKKRSHLNSWYVGSMDHFEVSPPENSANARRWTADVRKILVFDIILFVDRLVWLTFTPSKVIPPKCPQRMYGDRRGFLHTQLWHHLNCRIMDGSFKTKQSNEQYHQGHWCEMLSYFSLLWMEKKGNWSTRR